MQGQKYWEEKVPIYTEVKGVREQRKQKYLQEAKQFYNIEQNISNEYYNKLKTEILSGNENARNKLVEISINPIIDALAGIYAKYDIEEIVPFEEGLSYVLEKFVKSIKLFKDFPKLWCEYSVSTINYYVFNSITFCYQFMKYDQNNEELMQPSRLVWEMDKIEHEDFTYKNLTRIEARQRIIKVMSRLKPRSARVLALKFGLFDGHERTFEEISNLENVGRSRADQLVKATLHRMRRPENVKVLKLYSDYNLDLIN